jgi:hypothetical protein
MALAVDISEVSEDALALKEMLDGVVERVGTIYQSYNVPLPARRYWTFGTPIVDCEQMVVAVQQLYLGPPGDQASRPQRCNVPRTVVMNIMVARAVPIVGQNGRPPTAEQIEKAGYISAVDSWVLMQSINLLDQWDEVGFGAGVIATLEAPSAEGGYQVINLQVTMAVP